MKHPGERLPGELAHLREARPGQSGLEPVLDIKDRGRILLAQDEPAGRFGRQLFQIQLTWWPQRDRLVHNTPAAVAHRIDRLHRAAPAGVVAGLGDHGPHALRGLGDSDRFLDSHGDRRAVLDEQLVAVFLDGGLQALDLLRGRLLFRWRRQRAARGGLAGRPDDALDAARDQDESIRQPFSPTVKRCGMSRGPKT